MREKDVGDLSRGYEALQKLFSIAEIPSEWYQAYFTQAFITNVNVQLQKKSWMIHIHLPELVPVEVWEGVQEKIRRYLAPSIDASVQFIYDPLETKVVMEKYWHWIKKQIAEKSAVASSGWLGKAKWKIVSNSLEIIFPNVLMEKMARQKELDFLVQGYYRKLTGQEIRVVLKTDEKVIDLSEREEMKQQEEQVLRRQLYQSQMQEAKAREKIEERAPADSKIQLGNQIQDSPVLIDTIQDEEKRITVAGEVFGIDWKDLKSGRTLFTCYLTDYSNSIAMKMFVNREDMPTLRQIKNGVWLKVRGPVQYDTFSRDLVLTARDLVEVPKVEEYRMDESEEKRVELHFHTAMSAMDGLYGFEKEGFSKFSKVCERLKEWGHTALAITDHGVIQAFPEAYDVGKSHGIKMLLGMEANVVDDGVSIVMNPENRNLEDDVYVVFDVETTGLSVSHDVMIELAAVKMKQGKIIDRYETFINPHRPLSAFTTELTGITDDMVQDAPELHEILPDFIQFIEGSVIVAHNARFDMGFIQAAFRKHGHPIAVNPVMDTLELSRFLFPDLKNHRLNTLAKKLDVTLEQHHRAIYDTEATGEIHWKLLEMLLKREITQLNELNEASKDRDLNRLRPFHAIIFAKNKTGLKNLYELVSLSHIKHFYRVPRIPKSLLDEYREGLIIGSGCEKGELYETILNKTPEEAEEVAKFYDYLEIQPLEMNQHLVEKGLVDSIDRIKQANKLVVEIGEKLGKPVVATGNAHYLDEKDAIYREIVSNNQMGGARFTGALPRAHLRTTDEMLEEFAYLGARKAREVVIANTQLIADQIEDINPFPEGTYTPEIEGVEDELREICYETAHAWYGNPLPDIVAERLETELNGIISNGYAVIYMISSKLVVKSIEDGYLVGSRGSVGSSFVATMSRVSEVNPLPPHYRCQDCFVTEFVTDGSVETGFDLPDRVCPKCGEQMKKDGHDIPFATFLGFEGDKTPDIDLNFASDYQARCHAYTEDLLGKECIFRAGSVGTVKEKTAFGYVKKYAEENNRTFRQAEVARIANGCIGVKRTTGQHPGGLMVVPKTMDVEDFTPVQRPANNMKSTVTTTHFDYNAIGGKILKLDLLGHTAPAMLKMLKDMTGVDPVTLPTNDPKVIELFKSTESLGIKPEDISGVSLGTLGIPEFGTAFAQGILEIARPRTIGEFTRVSGLSHGTDVWAGNARELIQNGVCTLSEAICNRDDIMLYLIRRGLPNKTSFKIMEAVRKGKGLTEEQTALMREHDVPEWYIESCKKIKYMFPRAHAAAYVISAIWIAYYKVYHPEAFYAAYFSKAIKDFDIELMVKGYQSITNAMKEIKEKGYGASQKEKQFMTILELAQEMYARGIKFLPIDIHQSHASKFLIRDGGLLPPFASIAGVGESAAEGIAEAQETGEFLSIEDLQRRGRISSTVVESLQRMGCLQGLPESNQLSLFV